MLEEVRRMKQAVENAGLSYMELEKRTGVSHSTLQRYLTGKTNRIPLSAVEKIATATNVSAAWIMGWEESPTTTPFPAPTVTDDVVTFPVIGDVAAGYDQIAIEDWSGDTVQIPAAYLHGRPRSDYFVLNVHGDSMYPMYIEGDKVLVLKADTLERSGQVGVLLYNGDNATVKKIRRRRGLAAHGANQSKLPTKDHHRHRFGAMPRHRHPQNAGAGNSGVILNFRDITQKLPSFLCLKLLTTCYFGDIL